jgi:hypothetical protein
MFRIHNKVADSGVVLIREQGISTADTRVPAIATTFYVVAAEREENLVFEHIEIKYF